MKLSLRAARVNAGFSQEKLAKLIGVSKSTVSRWETGILPVPESLLLRICEICSLRIDSVTADVKKDALPEIKDNG